jgi:hypothetical protein
MQAEGPWSSEDAPGADSETEVKVKVMPPTAHGWPRRVACWREAPKLCAQGEPAKSYQWPQLASSSLGALGKEK